MILAKFTAKETGSPEVMLDKVIKETNDPNLHRYLVDLKENPSSVLHNDRVFQKIASYLRNKLEPKTNRTSATNVSVGGKDIPGFRQDAAKNTLLPHYATNSRNVMLVKKDGVWVESDTRTPLRKSMSFPDKQQAFAEIAKPLNMRRLADLFKCDEEGKPIFAMDSLRPDAVEFRDGQWWINGALKTEDRIPSANLLSGSPGRVSEKDLGEASGRVALVATSESQRKGTGGDFDVDASYGETFFVDKEGFPIWDESEYGLMNRRLNMLAQDYYEMPIKYLTQEKAFGGEANDIETLKDMFKAIAKKMPSFKATSPRNTRAFFVEMMKAMTGGKESLAALAKSNNMFDVESTHGMFYKNKMKIGGMDISWTKEDAAHLMSPEGLKDRMFLKNIMGNGLINLSADDGKDPHISHLFAPSDVGMVLAAMKGMHLKETDFITTTDKDGKTTMTSPKLEKFFTWWNSSPVVEQYRKAMVDRVTNGWTYRRMWKHI